MWDYLDSLGVLENGSDEEIKAAKRAYRKGYFLLYKKKQREQKREYTISFSKEKGEYSKISAAAKVHKRTVASFIRVAALAYIDKTYVVPDRLQIAQLEQLLLECLNEIKTIIHPKEKYFWERDKRLEQIERRIEKLEAQVNEVFCNPPLLHDRQNQIA